MATANRQREGDIIADKARNEDEHCIQFREHWLNGAEESLAALAACVEVILPIIIIVALYARKLRCISHGEDAFPFAGINKWHIAYDSMTSETI